MQRKRAIALAVTLTTATAATGATAMAVTGALGLGPSPVGAEVGTSVPDTAAAPDTLAPVVVYEDIPVPVAAPDTVPPTTPRPGVHESDDDGFAACDRRGIQPLAGEHHGHDR